MEHKPNVILIVMDTARADHFSSYGYYRQTTPNLDNIARRGVLFENAFSAAPWTPPSHASIFTGKYPSHHGTTGDNIYFNKENSTLAEILQSMGYKTFGITCCGILSAVNGFNKGFEDFIEMYKMSPLTLRSMRQCPIDTLRTLIYGPDEHTYRTIETAKKFLRRHSGKKPFFMFINFFNCHAPYNPPIPFKQRFCEFYEEPKLFIMQLLMHKIFHKPLGKIRYRNLNMQKLEYIASGKGAFSYLAKEIQISEEEWEVIKSWYDGEIAYLDYRIGEFVSFLCDEGLFDKTIFILTSDHGESFGEHGLADHPFCLYDNILKVPLIMTYPTSIPEGKRFSELVSTVDIFPTVLDILGNNSTKDKMDGRSLYPFDGCRIHDFICAEYGGRPIFTGIDVKLKARGLYSKLKCVRTESHKYILSSNKKEELYDIRSDPQEKINMAINYPRKIEQMKERLEKCIGTSFSSLERSSAKGFKEKILSRLKALGYIASD